MSTSGNTTKSKRQYRTTNNFVLEGKMIYSLKWRKRGETLTQTVREGKGVRTFSKGNARTKGERRRERKHYVTVRMGTWSAHHRGKGKKGQNSNAKNAKGD